MWLINLVENLLAVTRIEGGQVNLTRSIELMDEVVSEALKHINRKSKEHTIRVTSGKDFILAHIDAKLIVQVIINLVDNAIKYNYHGGRVIVLAQITSPTVLEISISDTGRGISPENLPRVKEKFYKTDNTVAGSGIGLAVADEIVKLHGGNLNIDSILNEGTTVTITLPIEAVTYTDEKEVHDEEAKNSN